MKLRRAYHEDAPVLWEMFHEVIVAGDSYVFDETTTRDEAMEYWLGASAQCFVAQEQETVLGAFVLRPNRVGRGAHIANASFMVQNSARGKGVGRFLGEAAIAQAKAQGYQGMQYNFVVSTNTAAVRLWESLGFSVSGKIPGGFNHKTRGFVDAYSMFRPL